MYFNTHTHLNSEEQYERRDELIKRCLEEGVTQMTVVGYDLESSRLGVQIAHEYDFVYCTVGISPNDCEETTDEDLEEIKELAKDPKVVAIGEIGLDYHWDVPHDKQWDVFAKQIAMAKELDLPIVIHSRDASEDTYRFLSEAKHRGIMHCYGGSYEMALRYIDIGFYISLAGPVTFKNARKPKEVATKVPLTSLLIETDDPYLSPVPFRGKRNEPANVIYVARQIAELKGISVEEVANTTKHNAETIFDLNHGDK
ncbi:MAG: TatD family hydrolase [Erysipelotrichaceae bacterium]|nr:TatD family hydrolase [Erysipelotrichaceae bacterium]